jgi:ribonucleoside-diphosphate reductase alpha chain
VEVPVDWSMTATNIVASKYLHGQMGTPERETGVRQLVARVAETVRDWGMAGGYFATPWMRDLPRRAGAPAADAEGGVQLAGVVQRGLRPAGAGADGQNWHWDPVTGGVQYSATGYRNPQCSACFINAVDDSLDSILTLAKTEGMLFKWGSGTGTNLSSLRGSMELLSGGGQASGAAELHARL